MASFFQKDVHFIFGAAEPGQLDHPDLNSDLPEWGIVGRSNVGKSSLINALFNRKKLARTSHTPGRTRQINFFNCNNECLLADLPGYGYAKISKAERAQWDVLIDTYLTDRPNLRLLLLLIDSRHELKSKDVEMMTYLDSRAVPYLCVFTKTDKAKTSNLNALEKDLTTSLRNHPAALETVMRVSAHKKTGLEELRTFIVETLDKC